MVLGSGANTGVPTVHASTWDADEQSGRATRNWPAFRGPHGQGVGHTQSLPVEWDVESGHNIRWAMPIPGYSHSSPIVWGDRVFVVTAVSADPAADGRRDGARNNAIDDLASRQWKIYALDRRGGEIVWERTAHSGVPRVRRHEKGTHANSTPTTDGHHVVAIFNSEGLFCWSFDGEPLWQKDLGRVDPGYWGQPDNPWGHASSPVLFEDTVIVQIDRFENSFIAAYALSDGTERWRVPREEMNTWSTPVLHEVSGRWELITQGGNFVRSYDPRTGEELWQFADHAEVKVPSPLVADDKVIVTGGAPRGRPIFALHTGASADISSQGRVQDNSRVAWVIPSGGPYTSTPLAIDGVLFNTTDNGVLAAYDLATGERLYRQRLGFGFSASAVAGDGKLYLTSEDGEVYVVRIGREFELLATNAMGETCFATPALVGDMLIVRTRQVLYGVGS